MANSHKKKIADSKSCFRGRLIYKSIIALFSEVFIKVLKMANTFTFHFGAKRFLLYPSVKKRGIMRI